MSDEILDLEHEETTNWIKQVEKEVKKVKK